MKNAFICLLLALGLTACKAPVSSSSESDTTSDQAAAPEAEVKEAPATSNIVVNVPEKGADWVDHVMKVNGAVLILSAPKKIDVQFDDYGIYVRLNKDHSMTINYEGLDVKDKKQRYLSKASRKDLQWLIDTDEEVLYTGQDLGAPEGHQTTHSFFATKKIGSREYSTNVDGITVDGDHVSNLSHEDSELLLGIFRTLRAK